jgi:uncharacterized membrane protein
MGTKRFWKGFAAGAAAGAGAGFGSWLLSRAVGNRQHNQVVRLEKSVQIGRPVGEVFGAWSNLEQLGSMLRMVEGVQVRGDKSHWRLRIDGRTVDWDAQITQRIDNEAIGWKSLSGPKHTGRINFSPLGNNTEIHVVMNYSPPLGPLGRGAAENTGVLQSYVEQGLRDFKAALEGKGQEGREGSGASSARRMPTGVLANEQARATGTTGVEASARTSGAGNPVEYTRPPDAKS